MQTRFGNVLGYATIRIGLQCSAIILEQFATLTLS